MNICEERHTPKYRVTYLPAKNCSQAPVWMVCESCIASKTCFGDKDQILTMEILA